jgi:hypothetical protein
MFQTYSEPLLTEMLRQFQLCGRVSDTVPSLRVRLLIWWLLSPHSCRAAFMVAPRSSSRLKSHLGRVSCASALAKRFEAVTWHQHRLAIYI